MKSLAKRSPACIAALGLIVMSSSASLAATPTPSGKLSWHSHKLLDQALESGQSRIVLLLAAKASASSQAVSQITGLGGRIEYRDDGLGYLRVSIPTSQAKAIADLSAVQYADVDETVP